MSNRHRPGGDGAVHRPAGRPWAGLAAGLAMAIAGHGAAAEGDAPLSAIDWLSQSVRTPVAMPAQPAPRRDEPAVSTGAGTSDITTSVLDAPSIDGAGVLPPSVTGLPRDLWGLGRTDEIAELIRAERADTLPALQTLFTRILLAEALPPADSGGDGRLLLARVDRLLDIGALDQAAALIEAAGTPTPDLFRRAFDISLLLGEEDRACDRMLAAPNLAPTFPARIFCLARSGDWNAAALTLRTAQALGYVSEEEDALLSRFLDPDLYEGEPVLPPPSRPSPLVWRMHEAIGEPLPTNTLPVAFAHADLRDTAGWKAQIEAAERLARTGAIDPNRLIGIYTERLPAASGGIWDRVEAVQRFDTAIGAADPGAVAAALPAAWAKMTEAELEVPFATLYAERLMRLPLGDAAADLAFRIALLSPGFDPAAATARIPDTPAAAFHAGIARGNLTGLTPPDSLARALVPAFVKPALAPEARALLDDRRLGEALLAAIDSISEGATGELRGVTEGLSLLREAGLEDIARRTALELLLLERRG